MRRFLIVLFLVSMFNASAQEDTVENIVQDTALTLPATPQPVKPKRIIKPSVKDSAISKDSLLISNAVKDTVNTTQVLQPVVKPSKINYPFDTFYSKLLDNPFFRTTQKPVFLVINERHREYKDEMFYLLSGLLLILAFIKLIFSRYFSNIFKLFFQPTYRQKQIREQLLQNNLPAFFLNLFFIFSAGAYIGLLAEFYNLTNLGFLQLFLYSSVALFLVYSVKYLVLSFAGWVFNVRDAVQSYSFIVFLINKILGILLVPFILLIAFSQPAIIPFAITLSLFLIVILFIYRYVASFGPVMREVKAGPGHFILYVIAVEIIPLLLIYKTLIIYLNNSH